MDFHLDTNINAGNPGNALRVATYSVTFPGPGTYNLYARLRVGPDGFNDDSFFYGNGFGAKSPTADGDWQLANGLAAGGFTAAGDAVVGNGTAGNLVWKWVNVSQFNPGGSGTETPITFTVPAGNLTQTFQIGARENGLDSTSSPSRLRVTRSPWLILMQVVRALRPRRPQRSIPRTCIRPSKVSAARSRSTTAGSRRILIRTRF
jgi:hypothetical protein